MKIELITCADSPQCVSAKMFLDLQGVEYTENNITQSAMNEIGFNNDEMPVLLVDGEVEMSGFDANVLRDLFDNN